eukprot:4753716-Amphidinium_carterae.1
MFPIRRCDRLWVRVLGGESINDKRCCCSASALWAGGSIHFAARTTHFFGAAFEADLQSKRPAPDDDFDDDFHIEGINVDLVSRTDMCSLPWHMDSRECVEATVEHLVWLLYPKFVHYSFVLAAARVLNARIRAKRMTLHAANVLLSYTWLVVT